ncbi:MAG: terminase large subunit, partial [Oscillospiraceae bacterium]|nr:terminase large subunit [Oscillospiraceae bacterium]
RWMFENVKLETDAAGNIKPSKKKSREKIDGVIGAIMALDGAIRREDAEIVGGLVTYNSHTGEWLRNGEPIVEKKTKKNWL